MAFESYRAAGDSLGGLFPGGQTHLFQGLWTDPVTGVAYARARWYDSRNATWLSEDPLLDIDSPNLYAFVGWSPAMATDPMGMGVGDWWDPRSYADVEFTSKAALSRSGRFLKGEVIGAYNAAKGTVNAVLHLDETVEGIITGAAELSVNWDRINVGELAKRAVTEYVNAPPEKQGEVVGAILFEVASGGAVAKGVTKLKAMKNLSKAADAAKAAEMAADAAKVVENIDDAADVARAVDKADDAADAAQIANNLEDVADASKSIPCDCLTAGTLVATVAGPKPIEDVVVGDIVWAQNEESKQTEAAVVVGLFEREAEATLLIEIAGENLRMTPEHPVQVVGRGWIEAALIEVGDRLVARSDSSVRVDRVTWDFEAVKVYNFEVEGLHSYYAGQAEILVHNCDTTPGERTPAPALRGDPYNPDVVEARRVAWHSQFEGLTKGLKNDVRRVMELVREAGMDGLSSSEELLKRRLHVLDRRDKGWTSVDLYDTRPDGREQLTGLRFLFKQEKDGSIIWRVADTHK